MSNNRVGEGRGVSYLTVREWLDYDSETGIVRWKIDRWRKHPGDIAGYVKDAKANTPLKIELNQKQYLLHRIIWLWNYGYLPSNEIDHKNRDMQDNRLSNLREATRAQNNANRRVCRNGLKGACRNKFGKWTAAITRNNKPIHLGTFATELKAHNAYMEAARKLHGEFARAG